MYTVNPESVGVSSERLSVISEWLDYQIHSERLAGASILFSRRGKNVFFKSAGVLDLESAAEFNEHAVVRIYSMTKPITSVAAMMLYERGHFQLDDPISNYITAFKDTPVWMGGNEDLGATEPALSQITVRQIMTHTSGLTYSFMHSNVIDNEYRQRNIFMPSEHSSIEQWVDELAGIPLLCQPGTQWNYSVSTDVLGRLVEIWSGQKLSDYLLENIFKPLGMTKTGFHVDETDQDNFASLYSPLSGGDLSNVAKRSETLEKPKGGLLLQESSIESRYLGPTSLYSGGGGLVSTISDYSQFCQMLLNGGKLGEARLLSPKTVGFMRLNQLPENRDMAAMGQPVGSETTYEGIGFGLGFAVVLDPVKAHIITSIGEHHWGGAASTFFWLDPLEDLYVVFLAQLIPSSTYPIRRELRAAIYSALID